MKLSFLLLLMLFCGGIAFSQNTNYAVWTAKVQPSGSGYDLILHVELRPGWHVYALDPGGDGMMIAPSMTLVPGKYTKEGPLQERGKLITKSMEGVLGNLRYYENQADFIQHIKASKGTRIEGSYNYQLCSESVCLPPKTETFRLTIP